MKNVNFRFARTVLLCALALFGVLGVMGTAAHADLTGPKPPNPPIGVNQAPATAEAQDFSFGAR